MATDCVGRIATKHTNIKVIHVTLGTTSVLCVSALGVRGTEVPASYSTYEYLYLYLSPHGLVVWEKNRLASEEKECRGGRLQFVWP